MKKYNPAEYYPDLISKLSYSPSREAVRSLERIKKKKGLKGVLGSMIDVV